jgi:hypothetical protein
VAEAWQISASPAAAMLIRDVLISDMANHL